MSLNFSLNLDDSNGLIVSLEEVGDTFSFHESSTLEFKSSKLGDVILFPLSSEKY